MNGRIECEETTALPNVTLSSAAGNGTLKVDGPPVCPTAVPRGTVAAAGRHGAGGAVARPSRPAAEPREPERRQALQYTLEMTMFAVFASLSAGFSLCWTAFGWRHGRFLALQTDVVSAMQNLLPRRGPSEPLTQLHG